MFHIVLFYQIDSNEDSGESDLELSNLDTIEMGAGLTGSKSEFKMLSLARHDNIFIF